MSRSACPCSGACCSRSSARPQVATTSTSRAARPPSKFIRSEWFIGTALLTGLVWILVYWAGLSTWWAAGIAFAVGFSFRLLAMFREWEEPMPKEPNGIVVHKDSVLLGRKLTGKSQRELADLGLTVENGQAPAPPQTAPVPAGAGGTS